MYVFVVVATSFVCFHYPPPPRSLFDDQFNHDIIFKYIHVLPLTTGRISVLPV